ncbi:unnamed protein product [Arctia plantaginis]|uniref:Uncharacterized protein n=1 Tax=Arctia plantaginis TaxID=874455 RepID=A0A8S0ZSM8_ARCPL|nr:unnamed protein product [Arctia plantaginis]CAB3261326.1 unnamed protein product [Arctia plantaginis]
MTAAMVPRMRRSQPTEAGPRICAPTTPCGWSIYNPDVKRVEMNITNTYCICNKDTICDVYEDDTTVSTYVLRCMKPPS